MGVQVADLRDFESKSCRSLAFALALFSLIYYWNAYVCDDAFITFRTLDNFVRGHGLRWNIGERVQVFTSPLQTMLMAPLYWLIYDRSDTPNPGRIYWLAIGYSFCIASAGIVWLSRSLRGALGFWFVLSILMTSQAYVTFTSSGLESVQTCLLVVLFYSRFLGESERSKPREYLFLFLIAGLAVLNRLDAAILFVLPCVFLAVESYKRFGIRSLRFLLWGALAPLTWLAFSLVYFGFLLPNSYYAKLGLGVESGVRYAMGVRYLHSSLLTDPATLVVCALGLILGAARRHTRLAVLSAGLYVWYVFSIGGDFLGFRFLAPPFVISTLVLHRFLRDRSQAEYAVWTRAGVVTAILYSLLTPSSPLRAFRDGPSARDVAYYAKASRVSNWRFGREFPFARFLKVKDLERCIRLRAKESGVSVWGDGLNGFCRGSKSHLIDPHGITDPFLARLPVEVDGPFRPGHIRRHIPEGYVASVVGGENRIADLEFAAYYDRLRTIVSGPLFTARRWQYIFAFNFTDERRFKSRASS